MVHYETIKSRALQKIAKRNSESILWDFSGSTLIHILIILGLGFYVTQPEPSIPEHTITINLASTPELSSETQLGQGSEGQKPAAQVREQKLKETIHVKEQMAQIDNGVFQLTPQNLINEIKQNSTAIEETERIGFLGVYDVHPAYRQYQQYWQSYVSQFGTKHYPRDLIEKGLNGTLELDIAIDKNGYVRETVIHRSSGNAEIDRAAIAIATLASPYAPLPDEMAKDIDILHIIRTWDFNNNTLTSRARE